MASGNSPEKLGRSGVAGGHCILVRTESLRAPIGTTQGRPAHDQWAKLRLIRDTISHYSPVLIAPLSNPISSRRLQKNKSASPAREGIAHETGHSALECISDQSAPTRGTYPSEWNFFNSRGGPLGGQLFGPPMDGGSPLGGSPGHRICYLWRNRRI